ncbi:MAG: hypothetical protein MI919_39490, partial [Holophagales bacterium]|nr:hypothetical protein [Holophagales bacterium]
RKAHNVSAILRTCDAVGVGELHGLMTEDSFRAKATSSAGSDLFVETRLHDSPEAAVSHLRGRGFRMWAAHLDGRSVDFRDVDLTLPTCVVLGQEGPGVSPALLELCQGTLAIPLVGAVASLNVSVAGAVILFEAQRQRLAAGLYDRPRIDPAERQRRLFEWGYKRLARWCRQHEHPYPDLDRHGQIASPFPRSRRQTDPALPARPDTEPETSP